MILEIRHRIAVDTDTHEYVLAENFGNQPQMSWSYKTLDEAKAALEFRRKFLTEMVARISPEAREAVEDARYIDNLGAGRA